MRSGNVLKFVVLVYAGVPYLFTIVWLNSWLNFLQVPVRLPKSIRTFALSRS